MTALVTGAIYTKGLVGTSVIIVDSLTKLLQFLVTKTGF
jgi:hypothetical protein